MNRTLSALFSALETVIVVGVGLAIPLVPLTILWGAQYGFAPDWTIFWRISADSWLIGHGADLTLTLDAATAKASGLAGAAHPFVVSIAALGFALVTVLLARRAGHRIAETGHRLFGEVTALIVFVLVSWAIAISAGLPLAKPNVAEGILLPTLCFAIGLLLARAGTGSVLPSQWSLELRATVGAALRGGAAASAFVIAAAALLVAVLLAGSYAQIITLYENLHSGALGGLVLTMGQILFLPNLVIWAASWLIGPGFAIGTGSTVSPLVTQLGPIPAIPVFGALPHASGAFAFAGLIVPILAGFLAGIAVRGARDALVDSPRRGAWMLAAGLGTGVVGGAVLGILAWASVGAIGPGTLQNVGPDPWAVALWSALEIGLAALLGMVTVRRSAASR
jgi:hypothetical protein